MHDCRIADITRSVRVVCINGSVQERLETNKCKGNLNQISYQTLSQISVQFYKKRLHRDYMNVKK